MSVFFSTFAKKTWRLVYMKDMKTGDTPSAGSLFFDSRDTLRAVVFCI